MFFSFYYHKNKRASTATFNSYYRSLFISSSITLFFITLTVSLMELGEVSRLFIIGIIILPSMIELLIVGFLRWWYPFSGSLENKSIKTSTITVETAPLQLKWVVAGFTLFSLSFILLVKLKYGVFAHYSLNEYMFLILFSAWIISIWLTGKYRYFTSKNLYYHLAPFIKSGFIFLIIMGGGYFFFRLEDLSRFVLFGTILAYVPIELFIFSIILMGKQRKIGNQRKPVSLVKENLPNHEAINIFGQKSLSNNDLQIDLPLKLIDIRELFKRVSVPQSEDILQFLQKYINVNLERHNATLLSTISIENIKVLQSKSQNLLMNLHHLNDIRRLNDYLITCGDKIKSGGMLFGCFVPLARDRQKLRSKMPRIMFNIIYPIHFMFYRVLPKLPKVRHLYFVITKGKGRVVSKAEILGRLSFCGYNVIAEKIIDNTLYFIAKKVRTVSTEKEPSYSPIVRLKRVGLSGSLITVFKLRTMHPYSEFIQEEIFKHNNLDPSGKIKEDFRLTNWGGMYRKLWIDEIPQLYNWIRGDITLIGVRALSEHYFSLYPKDLQILRTKYKPGLIPPYYADMPKKFNDILESERKYLQRKQKKQYSTDFLYFWKVFQNIVFNGARSK